MLAKLTQDAARPYAVVLGGSKVSDKLAVIEALAPKVDTLVIGGGMFYTFLAAQGVSVGNSLCEESMIETCKDLLDRYADVIHIPQDVVSRTPSRPMPSRRSFRSTRFPTAGWVWTSDRSRSSALPRS